jgi:RimJ/RimL family protein N-acetyltransferase
MRAVGKQIVINTGRVLQFVQERCFVPAAQNMMGIGLEEDGSLIAGVLYDGYNEQNVWMHVAAIPGRRWLNRAYLQYCFDYPFNIMKVKRISGWVEEDNVEARRFDEHLGFKHECTLKGAGKNGVDVLIYAMWRDQCRFIGREEPHG